MNLFRLCLTSILEDLGIAVRRLGTRSEGRRVQQLVLQRLETSREPLIVFDLAGLEMMNSSFADEVVALPLQRLRNGDYGDRYLVLDAPCRELVEDVQGPLEKRDLSLVIFEGFPDGGWWIGGIDRPVFRPLLELLMRQGSLETGAIARLLDISVQNCSNRLTELARRGLIKRSREFGTKGGQTHINMSLLEAAK